MPPNSTVRVCRSFSFSSYRHIRAYACLRCSLLGNKKLKKPHIDSSWYYFWEKSIHWIKAYIAQGWIIMNLETDCWTVTLTLEMEACLYANWKSEWELKMTKQLKNQNKTLLQFVEHSPAILCQVKTVNQWKFSLSLCKCPPISFHPCSLKCHLTDIQPPDVIAVSLPLKSSMLPFFWIDCDC